MYDYWMIIVGGVLFLWGLSGLITGSTSIYSNYSAKKGLNRPPIFTYQGRGLAWVLTIMGGLLAGLYLLSHGTVQRIPPTRANSYAGVVFVAGLVLAFLVMTFQGMGIGRSTSGRTQKPIQGVSLADAARMLNMSEAELLQMAQNGGIQAHAANGSYVFHPEVLRSFQESMDSLK